MLLKHQFIVRSAKSNLTNLVKTKYLNQVIFLLT